MESEKAEVAEVGRETPAQAGAANVEGAAEPPGEGEGSGSNDQRAAASEDVSPTSPDKKPESSSGQNAPAEEPAANAAEPPAINAAEPPAVEAAKEPTVEAAKEPAVEAAETPAVEAAETPAVEAAKEPAVEGAETPAVEAANEPAIAPPAEVKPPEIVKPELVKPPLVQPPEPPTIKAIAPDHGPVRGGIRVEIAGARFVHGCDVRIGEAEVEVTFLGAELLAVTLPQRSSFGYADVRVTNPDGLSEVRVHGFRYDVPPLLEVVKPEALALRGGVVRVFGEAFAEGVTASVDGIPVPVVYKGEDCLEITIPPGEAGPVPLVITNPDGQSAELRGELRLSEGPVIESISPTVGLPGGGARVTISGRGFSRGCAVTLFGSHAPEVTFESDKKVSFVTPPHEAGQGSIRVTNPDGLSSIVEGAFEFRAAPGPSLTEVAPNRAWVSGGARLLVTGADFVEGVTVSIGAKDASAKWKNGGLLEVMVPPAAEPGVVELVITNPDGQSVSAGFTYERVPTPPKLISVAPNRGPTHGGVTVLFTGDNFDEQTVVRIAEVRTTAKVLSKTELEVLVPPHKGEGPVAIELVSGDGVAVRSEDVFYYNDQPPPKVTGVAPNQGPMSGNTRVSLEGEGFSRDCFVRIGRERPASIAIRGPNLIEIVTPPCKISGFVDIEVGTNQTGSSVAKNVFRFVALPPPQVMSVAPNKGTTAGGTELSISGKHFTADGVVKVGGKAVKYKLISPDLIECKTPPGDDGQMVDVLVRNADGKESVVRRAFAYDARYKS